MSENYKILNETHKIADLDDNKLAFVRSLNVQAYPCGRRKSSLVDADGNSGTVNDRYYIPFDPEARLNTESNNRKYSSLNGFTQTYLKWDQDVLNIAIAGYLFKINLTDDLRIPNDFGTSIASLIEDSSAEKIYANIIIESLMLFEGFNNYYTEVLRNQSDTESPSSSLDLLINDATITDTSDAKNYYFSGLSFSSVPLALALTEPAPYSNETRYFKKLEKPDNSYQQLISLCILEKVDNEWQIHQPALLPQIEHGDTEGSIKTETIITNNLDLINDNGEKLAVPALELVDMSGIGDGPWQLQFSFGS
jgi:hypothetical protein